MGGLKKRAGCRGGGYTLTPLPYLWPWFWGAPTGKFSKINPHFLQSEAFCDYFHYIIKVYFPEKLYG